MNRSESATIRAVNARLASLRATISDQVLIGIGYGLRASVCLAAIALPVAWFWL